MKHTLALILLSVLLAGAGCTWPGGRQAAEVETPPAVEFKAGHGIRLSVAAADFVALATTEVAARSFSDGAEALAVPASAVLKTARGAFVFVANGEWFLRTPVVAATEADGWATVTDGLYDGDVVVTHGAADLWVAEIQATNGGVACTDGH